MTMPQIDSSSRMQDGDWDSITHPMPEKPYQRDRSKDPVVDLGNGHKLHAVEYGNPNGEPVLFLHGGPGGGCEAKDARYFDPSRYRVILFDQRGCGESVPTTHTDLEGAMKGNNTAELVEDIDAVRKHFGINGKMHVEGGSWGSTLALAYAIKHPENVKSLTLRGVFFRAGQRYRLFVPGQCGDVSTGGKAAAGRRFAGRSEGVSGAFRCPAAA